MLVRDRMTRTVVTVSPHTSVLNARRLMATHGIRHLPVVVGDEVVGMVSDRDIRPADPQLGRALSGLQSDLLTGRYRRVETLMSAPAHVVFPKQDVSEAAELMLTRRISALPVVDHGRLVGIIGLSDCLRCMLDEHRAAAVDHIDVDAVVPLTRDLRNRAATPAALVIDPDPATRLSVRNDLASRGYRVTTCPGPTGGTACPAMSGAQLRCARVPGDTDMVVIDAGDAAQTLAAAYQRWLPGAQIRIPEPVPARP